MDKLERIRQIAIGLRDHSEPRVAKAGSQILELAQTDDGDSEDPKERERLNPKGLLSISQAMERAEKTRNTIKNWVKRGLLTEYRSKTNRELFVSEKELAELLQLTEVHAATSVPRDWKPTPYPARSESDLQTAGRR
jgi:hypothetical protein